MATKDQKNAAAALVNNQISRAEEAWVKSVAGLKEELLLKAKQEFLNSPEGKLLLEGEEIERKIDDLSEQQRELRRRFNEIRELVAMRSTTGMKIFLERCINDLASKMFNESPEGEKLINFRRFRSDAVHRVWLGNDADLNYLVESLVSEAKSILS